jgi:uncharacterized protein YggU (UPF0235/DUF167 family)
MSGRDFHLHDGERGSALAIRVIPLADKNQISKVLDDGTLEVHLATRRPNLDKPLRAYLAKVLGVNPRRISVVAGQDRSKKLVSIIDIEPGTVQKLIQKEIR